MTKTRGFTLIELMVVVAIVGILLAIAIPAYREQMRKSRRADAISNIGQMQLALERWRADHPSYGNPTALANYPVLPTSTFYTYTFPVANATAYQVQAAPIGEQADDRCGTFRLEVAAGVVNKVAAKPDCW